MTTTTYLLSIGQLTNINKLTEVKQAKMFRSKLQLRQFVGQATIVVNLSIHCIKDLIVR